MPHGRACKSRVPYGFSLIISPVGNVEESFYIVIGLKLRWSSDGGFGGGVCRSVLGVGVNLLVGRVASSSKDFFKILTKNLELERASFTLEDLRGHLFRSNGLEIYRNLGEFYGLYFSWINGHLHRR